MSKATARTSHVELLDHVRKIQTIYCRFGPGAGTCFVEHLQRIAWESTLFEESPQRSAFCFWLRADSLHAGSIPSQTAVSGGIEVFEVDGFMPERLLEHLERRDV